MTEGHTLNPTSKASPRPPLVNCRLLQLRRRWRHCRTTNHHSQRIPAGLQAALYPSIAVTGRAREKPKPSAGKAANQTDPDPADARCVGEPGVGGALAPSPRPSSIDAVQRPGHANTVPDAILPRSLLSVSLGAERSSPQGLPRGNGGMHQRALVISSINTHSMAGLRPPASRHSRPPHSLPV